MAAILSYVVNIQVFCRREPLPDGIQFLFCFHIAIRFAAFLQIRHQTVAVQHNGCSVCKAVGNGGVLGNSLFLVKEITDVCNEDSQKQFRNNYDQHHLPEQGIPDRHSGILVIHIPLKNMIQVILDSARNEVECNNGNDNGYGLVKKVHHHIGHQLRIENTGT